METILANADLNTALKINYSQKYREVLMARIQRKEQALTSYMGAEYQNLPKHTLEELNKNISIFTRLSNAENITDDKKQEFLNVVGELQSRKDNNDYCVEGTADYDYKIAYEQHKTNFVWPDANELSVRQTEEVELLALVQ